MGLHQPTTAAHLTVDDPLPKVSTIRRFHCHSCRIEVALCSRCDRGNIYCPACAKPRLVERIRKARETYRRSSRGKLVRAQAEGRRRARIRNPPPDFVGDRGSPSAGHKGTTPAPGLVGPDSGDSINESVDVRSHPVEPKGPPSPLQRLVRCACCLGIFIPFQRQGPRRGHEARLLRARGPPRAPAHGGRTP